MKESMRSKLKQIARRLEEIVAMLASPDVTNDMNRFRDLSRERAEIEPVVMKLKEYESTESDIETAREMLDDPESADFAQEEIDNGKKHLEVLEKDLQIMLLPRDPNDSKNIYLEIRAGTGGDEIFPGQVISLNAHVDPLARGFVNERTACGNIFLGHAVGQVAAVALMPALQPAVVAHTDKTFYVCYIINRAHNTTPLLHCLLS